MLFEFEGRGFRLVDAEKVEALRLALWARQRVVVPDDVSLR